MTRHLISSGSYLEPQIGFSRAVRVGNIIAVGGTAPIAAGGGTAAKGQMDLAMANSSAYLELFGHTVIAWQWLVQALAAKAARGGDAGYYAGKLAACRYFFRYELPKTQAWAELLMQLDDTLLHVEVSHL